MGAKFKYFQGQFSEFVVATADNVAEITKKTNETEFETKALRHYVDHFGDNLTLSSSQIIVESTAGISKKPMSLLDVCTQFNSKFVNIGENLDQHETKIKSNLEAIETKADASLAFDVQAVSEELGVIKELLKREEDQGINVSSSIHVACANSVVIIVSLYIIYRHRVGD